MNLTRREFICLTGAAGLWVPTRSYFDLGAWAWPQRPLPPEAFADAYMRIVQPQILKLFEEDDFTRAMDARFKLLDPGVDPLA